MGERKKENGTFFETTYYDSDKSQGAIPREEPRSGADVKSRRWLGGMGLEKGEKYVIKT